LKSIDEWSERRREIAAQYNELLTDKLIKPHAAKNKKHVYHLYVVRTKKRDELKDFLQENEIETGIHYPVPVHRQPIFEECHLPKTERACGEILSLPMYPLLSDEQVTQICDRINEFFE
jgi:dTDP-4-amino-4,6-dideoxygalactose transaminase